jgi:hypothetical protein
MTTGYRIKPKTFRLRKKLKKTVINIRVSYELFKDNLIKILLILTFIDNYNYYIERVDQLN